MTGDPKLPPADIPCSKQNQPSWPVTLIFGLGIILVAEALLFVDVLMRGGTVFPYGELVPPAGPLQTLSRWIAVNITPVCWTGFLFTVDGLLTLQSRGKQGSLGPSQSPVRKRPVRFIACFLASIPLWLLFDWVNFSYVDAWRYHGLPEDILQRYVGYFFAFGAISPAMFLAAELYQQLGLRHVRGERLLISRRLQILLLAIGPVLIGFPFVVRDPIGSLALWLGWFCLLDPINHWLGAPSIIGDWHAGRWGRTLALATGGSTCGLLWEFWNYWAVAKWTYNLPFLGPLEDYRYFEMPLVGLLGFPIFAIESWVMFQTVVLVFNKVGIRFTEPLPGTSHIA